LRAQGRVYIVTNGTEWIQNSRFTISGLFSMCDQAFISDPIGFDKPAKGYSDYVFSHIENFEKEKAVWIGDSLSADIKAANDACITSIWFNPTQKQGNDKAIPDYVANSFSQILSILKKINGRD
jgi:FMN phosphatase YigB (HAD superfamily)